MMNKQTLFVGVLMFFVSASVSAFKLSNAELLDCETQCDNLFSKLKKYASHGSPHAQTLLALAFKTGEGVSWGDHNNCLFCGTEKFFSPSYEGNLISSWLPAMEGLIENPRPIMNRCRQFIISDMIN